MSEGTAKAKPETKTGDGSATSPSKKPATDADKPNAAQDGTDERDPTKAGKKAAAVSSMTPEEIEGFETYEPEVQQIIRRSLELTTQNLRYQFGSADPKAGGMDCSGTMYRVLQDSGIKEVPRQSDEICRWVMRRTRLYRTEDTSTLKDKSLSALKPGDLLFWSGTYETSNPRELPISHVMLYLGKRKKDGKPVVFGASDGRTYDGQRRNGVSVFDFVMPKRDGKAAFYGYGPVPGLKLTTGTAAGR
jgi:cell wall-associated NlpC family hydrolase